VNTDWLKGRRLFLQLEEADCWSPFFGLSCALAQCGAQVTACVPPPVDQWLTEAAFDAAGIRLISVDPKLACQPASDRLLFEAAVVYACPAGWANDRGEDYTNPDCAAALLPTDTPLVVAPLCDSPPEQGGGIEAGTVKSETLVQVCAPPTEPMPCFLSSKRRWCADTETVKLALACLLRGQDLKHRTLLVTAGPTAEDIDPVRFITNRSTGRMGLAIAVEAACRGAQVLLVHGPLPISLPRLSRIQCVEARSAQAMYEAVLQHTAACAAVVMCAAVADFRPTTAYDHKLKKEDKAGWSLELCRTADILAAVGGVSQRPFLVGFAAETDNLVASARRKLRRKNCDLLCANDITEPGSGFAVETNRITLYRRDGSTTPLPLLTKAGAAKHIVDEIATALSSLR